jgi:hypothetical protein
MGCPALRKVSQAGWGAVSIEPEFRTVELDDLRWIRTEVAVSDPRRPRADVRDARPALPLAPGWERLEVELLQSFQLNSGGLVRSAFVLDGALVACRRAADDEGDTWIAPEVLDPALIDGVEEDLEVVTTMPTAAAWALPDVDTEAWTANECSRMKLKSSAAVIETSR